MGFVDGDSFELALLVDSGEGFADGVCQAELWGYVEEAGVGVAAEQVRLDLVAFFHGGLGVDGGDGDAGALQSSDLIVLS